MRPAARSPATTPGSCCTRRCTPTDSRRGRCRPRATTACGSSIAASRTPSSACRRGTSRRPTKCATCNGFLAADLAHGARGRRGAGARSHRARRDVAGARRGARLRIPSRTAARHPLDRGVRSVRQLPLQPLQHEHAAPHPGHVPRSVRPASPRISLARAGMWPTATPPDDDPVATGRARSGARRSTRASCSPRCRTAPASTGCSMRPARRSTSARRAISRSGCRATSRRAAHETADRRDARAGRARRDDGHALRGRGAAAREQPDQGARAALQHPLSRRQELSVRLPDRRPVSAASLPPRHARSPAPLFRALSRAPARCARESRCCRRSFSCAPARTPCSPTARGPACSTRSSAAAAPCVGFVSEADYRDDVQSAVLFLQGKAGEVLTQLQTQMDEASSRARVRARRAAARQDHAPHAVAVAAVRRERDGRRYRRRRGRGGAGAGRGERRDGPRRPARRRSHVLSAACRRRRSSPRSCRPFSSSTTSSGRCRRRSSCPRRSITRRSRRCCRRKPARKVEIVGNPGGERRVWLTMALQNADVRDSPEARAEGDAGRSSGRAAGGARPARLGAAHRMLRRLAHDGRARGRVVRDLRSAGDADRRIPALQRDAGAGWRRLCGNARGADAPLRADRRRRVSRRPTCSSSTAARARSRSQPTCSPSRACTTRG